MAKSNGQLLPQKLQPILVENLKNSFFYAEKDTLVGSLWYVFSLGGSVSINLNQCLKLW